MGLPNTPVTLTVEQIVELNNGLRRMVHEINNHLSVIVAVGELIRINPETIKKMSVNLVEKPPRITDEMAKFRLEFNKIMGIT
jgi:hypothetical protein